MFVCHEDKKSQWGPTDPHPYDAAHPEAEIIADDHTILNCLASKPTTLFLQHTSPSTEHAANTTHAELKQSTWARP